MDMQLTTYAGPREDDEEEKPDDEDGYDPNDVEEEDVPGGDWDSWDPEVP